MYKKIGNGAKGYTGRQGRLSGKIYLFLKNIYLKAYVLMLPSLIRTGMNRVFAGSGTLGFKGGVFNPGSLSHDNGIIALAKAQERHWLESVRQENINSDFMKGEPLLFHFDRDIRLLKTEKIEGRVGFPETQNVEIEDLRMFKFNDTVFVNHSMCHVLPRGDYDKCEQVLSTLNTQENSICYLGQPKLDISIRPIEKNWAYFEHSGELYLLYSFSPYILLKAVNWPKLDFKTVVKADGISDWCMGRAFRNTGISLSANPIPYDDKYFLTVVHRYFWVDGERVYFHWAVLIDRQTLLPAKISSRPVYKGGRCKGMMPGIIYTSSVILRDGHLVFFNGEGDSYCSYARIGKKALDRTFVDIKWERSRPARPAVSDMRPPEQVRGLVSVIMPLFNAERYMREAVESVLQQSYPSVELILVDDGSTDNSRNIAESLAKEHPGRITILRQEHKGPYPARNLALKRAKGEYIAFLDADDWWGKDCLRKLCDAIAASNADLVYCGWQNIGRSKLESQPHIPPKYESGDIVGSFLKVCPWPIHAALLRKTLVEKIGGFSERYFSSMDYDLWLRAIAASRNIVLVPEVMAFYRWHDMKQISQDSCKQSLNAWMVRRDFARDNPDLVRHLGKRRSKELIDGSLLEEGYKAYWKRDVISARKLFQKALITGCWGLKDLKYIIPSLLPEKAYRSFIRALDRARSAK